MHTDTPYARWMRRHRLTHREAAQILGISESSSHQYAAGFNRTSRQPMEPPVPILKLMRAKDLGATFDPLPIEAHG